MAPWWARISTTSSSAPRRRALQQEAAPALARAANDNGQLKADNGAAAAAFEPLLIDALHHFAVHGLAAASAALEQAGDAAAEGDADARDHWLAVTRMFDRRLAARVSPDLAPA